MLVDILRVEEVKQRSCDARQQKSAQITKPFTYNTVLAQRLDWVTNRFHNNLISRSARNGIERHGEISLASKIQRQKVHRYRLVSKVQRLSSVTTVCESGPKRSHGAPVSLISLAHVYFFDNLQELSRFRVFDSHLVFRIASAPLL